jgi:single-stranded DNA-binding protein|nr:MAG TPA: Single strand binding protein [Bacteriophage sp.]
MARNTNTVILIGHLGGDPEIRQFQNGGQIATFNLAIGDDYRDKQGDTVNLRIGYQLWYTAILPMWRDNIFKKAQKSA